MVNIDTVYQKVLMFANKEQRGYITPQEFNLFANQAQLEIIEQYFYDLSQFDRNNGKDLEYSDIVTLIQEKIGTLTKLHKYSAGSGDAGFFALPSDCYKIGTVTHDWEEIDEITLSEYTKYNRSRLTLFNDDTKGYVVQNWNNATSTFERGMQIYPNSINAKVRISYVKIPSDPKWSYIVVNGKALYDPSNKNDFELHPAEETELVYKILKYAGLSMKRDDLAKGGQGLESLQTQQEKQ